MAKHWFGSRTKTATIFIAIMMIASLSYGFEFGFKGGAGLSMFEKGYYNLEFTATTTATDYVMGVDNEGNSVVIDTNIVILSGKTSSTSELTNRGSYIAGIFGRYTLKEYEYPNGSGWLRFNVGAEMNWSRYSAQFKFGKDVTNSYLFSVSDVSLTPSSSVMDNVATIVDSAGIWFSKASSDLTIDYFSIPVLFEVQQIFKPQYLSSNLSNRASIYLGPSFTFKLNENESQSEDIAYLQNKLLELNTVVIPSIIEEERTTVVENNSFVNKIVSDMRTDFVLGMNWEFADVLPGSIILDIRGTLGMKEVTKFDKDNFTLSAITGMLGYRF